MGEVTRARNAPARRGRLAPAGERAGRLDLAGLAILAALVAWILIAAVAGGTNPLPMLGTVLGAAAVLALARGVAVGGRPLGPAVVLAAAATAVVIGVGGLTGAAAAPLLYANANAALYLQAVAAGLMVAFTWTRTPPRVTGLVAAGGFSILVLVGGSRAGIILLGVLLLGGALTSRRGAVVRVLTVLGAGVVTAALIVTVVAAAGGLDGRGSRELGGGIGQDRVRLWSQALDLMEQRPLVGFGPGTFGSLSSTARRDRDLGWAHHEFLQQGAETGLPGLLLLLMAFLWAFARLWVAPPDPATGIAAVALGVLGMHACFDYILHFPVIPLAAAALVGTAQASRGRSGEDARPEGLARKALKSVVLPLGLSGGRRPGDVSILLYHRVGAGDREIDLSPAVFGRQLGELASGDRVVSLEEALGGEGGTVVTIDDGLRDFHEHVLPALSDRGLRATLYLATSLVVEEGGDPREGLTWDHLREAVGTGLVTMGSHTHGHADLSRASAGEAEDEVRRSKELIEDRLGVPCRHFAYPWGVGSPAAEEVVRRHFDSATLGWGTNREGRIDRYRLARVPVMRSDGPFLFRAKVAGRLDREALLYRLLGRGPWRRA
jgi:O-antigen ligase/peptidoglycan/xylan/chitin deacetylase (PgdA/CDA1 family)